MNKGIQKVLETIEKDEAFAEKIGKCKSPKEAYELALTVADSYTLEEFQDVMTQIHDAVTKFGERELSKEDLAKVSGGTDGWEIAGYTIVGTLTVGSLGTVLATMAV